MSIIFASFPKNEMKPTCFFIFNLTFYVYYMPMPAVDIDSTNDHDV